MDNLDEIYLTPNLVIKNKKTYYINDETNKWEKVMLKNWHKYLNEYGWEKLDGGWIRRLNRYKNKKDYNSRWGILDCGGDGDCLFYVIAEAIMEPDMQQIRRIASEQITDENFEMIIESYRLAYDNEEFDFSWNPHEIQSKDELRERVMETGNNYWADYIIVQLLSNALGLNFIILNSEKLDKDDNKIRGTLKERFNIHSLGMDFNPDRRTIIIYYIDSRHFKLVGYFNDDHMQTIFDEIPEELMIIFREDCKKENLS